MAKPKSRRATLIVTLMVIGFLVFLFQYLINYDYKVETIETDVATQLGALEPELKIEEDDRRHIVLRFSLRNTTANRLKIADSIFLAPLYDLKMHARQDDGTYEICPPTAQSAMMKRRESLEKPSIDRESVVLVELLPTAAYTRTIPLSELFEFKRNGSFSVTIGYHPELLSSASPELTDLKFYKQQMKVSANFELPFKKAAPPPIPAPVEKPKAQPGAGAPKKVSAVPVAPITPNANNTGSSIPPGVSVELKPREEAPKKQPDVPTPPAEKNPAAPVEAPKE